MCQIQDNFTLKMIGHVDVCNGLYYLQSFPIFDQDFIPWFVLSYKRVDVNLWHYRLGHHGNKTIEQILKKFPYV